MLLLGEVLLRLRTLQYCDETQGVKVFSENLEILRSLEKALLLRNRFGAQNLLEEFTQTGQLLMTDYRRFVNTLRERSKTFCYWDNVIELIEQLKNLIRADCESNWLLHMHTVRELLHIFAAFNCTNYLRFFSIYLEDMKNLPETHPDINEAFMLGKFSVKRTKRCYSAVGADMSRTDYKLVSDRSG